MKKTNKQDSLNLEQLAHDKQVSPQDLARMVSSSSLLFGRKSSKRTEPRFDVLCVGGANLDYKLHLLADYQLETSNPVRSSTSLGGVIRNVADNLVQLRHSVALMTLLGQDQTGDMIAKACQPDIDLSATERLADQTTGSYIAVLDATGALKTGFADMTIADGMDEGWIQRHQLDFERANFVVVDCNLTSQAIEQLITYRQAGTFRLGIVTISTPKMAHLPSDLAGVDVLITNLAESQAYFGEVSDASHLAKAWLERGVRQVVITQGANLITYADQTEVSQVEPIRVEPEAIIDVTGAGDAFSAATISRLIRGQSLSQAVRFASLVAAKTIQSSESVRHDLDVDELEKESSHA